MQARAGNPATLGFARLLQCRSLDSHFPRNYRFGWEGAETAEGVSVRHVPGDSPLRRLMAGRAGEKGRQVCLL